MPVLPSYRNQSIDLVKKTRHETNNYRKSTKYITRAVHLFGRQKLALTGNRESIADQEISDKPGNFIAFIKEIASYIVQNLLKV